MKITWRLRDDAIILTEHLKQDLRVWAQYRLVRVENRLLNHARKLAHEVNIAEWHHLRQQAGVGPVRLNVGTIHDRSVPPANR